MGQAFLDRQFLGSRSALPRWFARLAAVWQAPERTPCWSEGRRRRLLEGGVEVGLHLRVLGFFVSEPLFDPRQFFRFRFQRGNFRLRGFELFAQSGLTRLGQQTLAGQSLIELFLSCGTALRLPIQRPKSRAATPTSANTITEFPTEKILFA